MSKSLPLFQKCEHETAKLFISGILSKSKDEDTHLVRLIAYSDGHFRAIFDASYFGDESPSKSQWNTLKKKLKRHNRQVFVYREYGYVGKGLCYLDFGFMAE